MYKLLIIAYLFNGSVNSGTAVSISSLNIQTHELCVQAKKDIDDEGSFLVSGIGAKIGAYRVVSRCIKSREE